MSATADRRAVRPGKLYCTYCKNLARHAGRS